MTQLTELWLQTNSISGLLPLDFSGLTGLQNVSVRDNGITAPVPDSLPTLQSLRVVNLTNNKLQPTGTDPEIQVFGSSRYDQWE